MSASVNIVILQGRLGRNPEIRYTQGGKGVANMSLATDETYKDKQGERQKKTTWHNLVSWISIEFIEQYLHAGDLIFVQGRIQTREWQDKEGVKRVTTEISVQDIKPVVTARTDSAPQTAARPQQRAAARPAQRQAQPQADVDPIFEGGNAPEITDEDIPF
jgi:single-strand DNA-binding protein